MIESQKKVLIIDDDPDAIENLKKLLAGHIGFRVAGSVTDANIAVEAIRMHQPDLIFLDIQMPGKDGFEVLRDMLSENLRAEIIFVIAYDKFAIDAIRFSALDYLLKPVSPFDLQNALIRFMGKANNPGYLSSMQALLEKTIHTHKLKFNTHSGFFMLAPEDIVYIQADWNYSEVFVSDTKSELVTMNIGKLEEMLPKHQFYRINRSTIINVSYLVRIVRKKRAAILEKDGKEYTFKIPLMNIRKIENFIDHFNSTQPFEG